MKKVSVVDNATQTDPITILDSAVQSDTKSKTEELQKQTDQLTPRTNVKQRHLLRRNKAEGDLKKDTMKMVRKDWKKQQQKKDKQGQSSPYERPNKIKI